MESEKGIVRCVSCFKALNAFNDCEQSQQELWYCMNELCKRYGLASVVYDVLPEVDKREAKAK